MAREHWIDIVKAHILPQGTFLWGHIAYTQYSWHVLAILHLPLNSVVILTDKFLFLVEA